MLIFFFNDTATTEIYTLSLHDALPIFHGNEGAALELHGRAERPTGGGDALVGDEAGGDGGGKGKLGPGGAGEGLGLRGGGAERDGGPPRPPPPGPSPPGRWPPPGPRET